MFVCRVGLDCTATAAPPEANGNQLVLALLGMCGIAFQHVVMYVSAVSCLLHAAAQGVCLMTSRCEYVPTCCCRLRCNEAVAALSALPLRHKNSGWALALLGRTHLELANYKQACIPRPFLRL